MSIESIKGTGARRARAWGRSRAGLWLPGIVLSFAASISAQAQAWVRQGPGPTTLGQVENIADREVAGAINAIVPHPTDPNILYVGSVNGGIWRTGNAQAANPTWVEQLGQGRSLSVGALELDPTDATHRTLVAGTGNTSSSWEGGSLVGLWRTTDGGASWTGITGGGALADLNIVGLAPRGATLVVAANKSGQLGRTGIWRSTDGGATFVQVSGATGSGLPRGPAYDLASDPDNPARLYTNAGSNGLYRSTDTGATWSRVSSAGMDDLIRGANRVRIATGRGANVYAAIVVTGALAGVFRSADGGSSWTVLDLPRTLEHGDTLIGIHAGGQGTTHLSLAVDPANPAILYIGGDRQPNRTEFSTKKEPRWPNSIGARDYSGRLFRIDASQPAGRQATHLTHSNTAGNSAPHADSRDMAFSASGDLLEADDGGIYKRTSPRTNTGNWFSLNGDLVATEFHSISWDANVNAVIGGTQDTGTPQQQPPVGARFFSVSTGDGGDVAVDDFGSPGRSVRYSSFQNFQDFRRQVFDVAGKCHSQTRPKMTLLNGARRLVPQFVTPIAINAVEHRRLVIGADNGVYESTDQGETLTEIARNVRVNAVLSDPMAYGGRGNPDILYVGAEDLLYSRTGPPATSRLLPSRTYPGRAQIADVVIDPGNARIAYVVDVQAVYRTTNADTSWTNITGNLQSLSPGRLRSATYADIGPAGLLIVGTSTGVFAAAGPSFTTWRVFGTGMPQVQVLDLDYDARDRVLVAGTHGRGAWVVNLAGLDGGGPTPPDTGAGNGPAEGRTP